MNIRDKIKKKILDDYTEFNKNSANIIDLNKPAKDNEDPFFIEYKKALIDSIRFKNQEEIDGTGKNEDKKQLEESADLYTDEEEIDPAFINDIELKIGNILKKLKMDFFENTKDSFKKLMIQDIESRGIINNLNEAKKNKIIKLVNDFVENEIREFKSKKEYRKKEMLKDLLQKINPMVNAFFEKNNYNKLMKMTLFQRKNLINYFFEEINNKYIQSEFLNKNIDDSEFKFLKSKVMSFIVTRYEKILSEKIHN